MARVAIEQHPEDFDADIRLADVSGVAELDGYQAARHAGANHDDAVAAHSVGIGLRTYADVVEH